MLSSHCPGIYDRPNGEARPLITGLFSSSIWVYVPERPSSLICFAPVMASEYPTVTLAEFSKLSARLQHAILQSPAAVITSVLMELSFERVFPCCLAVTTDSSTSFSPQR